MCLKANNYHLILCMLFFMLLSWGCQSAQKSDEIEEGKLLASVAISYAEGFSIDYFADYTKVIIHNPWTNEKKPYAVYYLCKSDSILTPTEGTKLKIPLSSLAVNTFTYFEFLRLLEEPGVIKGVTDGFRIYNPAILQKIETREIIDLGDPFNPNVERTMSLMPQAIINSAYAQQDSYSERLLQAGFPIIYSLEWMETSPLARAEWIKMIAAFFDKGAAADSIFRTIEQRYLALQVLTKNVSPHHTVMAGDNFQGTWYVPGGKSFNASLFRDAGLDYRYKNNHESGSIGLDIESVLTQFGKAAFWVGCEADTYGELAEKDAKYLLLESVKKRQVFNNHNRITASGGNDYFESAIAHPDLILSDLIKATHPQLLPDYSFTYIKPLEESPAREK